MTITDFLMIGAVLLAPLIAVQVQKWLEGWREKRQRKIDIFKTIMATRATRLDHSHVTAINMIDLEFKEKKVLDAWEAYIDSLEGVPEIPAADASESEQSDYRNDLKSWSDKNDEKFIDLLYEISCALKYKFNKVHLKKAIYYPRGHSDLELEQQLFRRAAISFLTGRHPVQMSVTSVPGPGEEVEHLQAEFRKYLSELLEGKRTIPVSMSSPEDKQAKTGI